MEILAFFSQPRDVMMHQELTFYILVYMESYLVKINSFGLTWVPSLQHDHIYGPWVGHWSPCTTLYLGLPVVTIHDSVSKDIGWPQRCFLMMYYQSGGAVLPFWSQGKKPCHLFLGNVIYIGNTTTYSFTTCKKKPYIYYSSIEEDVDPVMIRGMVSTWRHVHHATFPQQVSLYRRLSLWRTQSCDPE